MAEVIGRLSVHPAASSFPMLDDVALAELAADIAEHGQRDPCIVWGHSGDGCLVDGRNRMRACELAGVEPLIEYRDFDSPAEVVEWIVSRNIHRRHLTTSQRAVIAAKLMRSGQVSGLGGKSRDEVARRLSVSPRSVQSAATVVDHGVPDLVEALETGKLSTSAAEKIATLPQADQPKAMEKAEQREKRASERKSSLESANSSESEEHYTDPAILESARRVLGAFDLDVASCEKANTLVRATTYFTREDDGYSRTWFGRVWMNSPYGKSKEDRNRSNMERWLSKLLREYQAGNVEAACFEVNAYTGADWFSRLVWQADAVCLIDNRSEATTGGRLRHIEPASMEPQNDPRHYSVIGYLGPDIAAFVREFSVHGFVIPGQLVAEWQANLLGGGDASAFGGAV